MEFKVGEKVKVVKLSPEFNGPPYRKFLGKSGIISNRNFSSYKNQNKYLILFPSEHLPDGVEGVMGVPVSFYEDELAKYYPKSLEEWE